APSTNHTAAVTTANVTSVNSTSAAPSTNHTAATPTSATTEKNNTPDTTTSVTQTSTMSASGGHESHALSSGSIAVIMCAFIVIVLLVFVGLYYYRIRHRSYGPLLENNERTNFGNFANPMYDP
ncbi:hypothetical protein FQN60_008433, partial [Etheostoma spectabile]